MHLKEVIKDWLVEYKSLADYQVNSFAEVQKSNSEIHSGLYEFFSGLSTNIQLLEPVCHQLFNFYRSPEPELKRFTLSYIPSLICYLLEAHSYKLLQTSTAVEACLLGIYNLEIVCADGEEKVSSFNIPSLAEPSVYHEPPKISSLALTETTLSRFANNETKTWTSGPFEHYEAISTQNRDSVFTVLLQSFNADLANLNAWTLENFCQICFRIAGSGFKVFNNHESTAKLTCPNNRGWQRLSVSPGFLVEMLSSIYFCMYNGHMCAGKLALEAIHQRACYELYPDVQLVTNAIKNSLVANEMNTMGISPSILPTISWSSVSKTALTNASFRAQKLPDDINIPESSTHSTLSSIDEQTQLATHTDHNNSSKVKPAKHTHRNKGDKSRGHGQSESKQAPSTDDPDTSLHVVVSNKKSRTPVDVIELNLLTSTTVDGGNGEEPASNKPRSSSLTSSSPLYRQTASRHSSHAINSSTHQP